MQATQPSMVAFFLTSRQLEPRGSVYFRPRGICSLPSYLLLKGRSVTSVTPFLPARFPQIEERAWETLVSAACTYAHSPTTLHSIEFNTSCLPDYTMLMSAAIQLVIGEISDRSILLRVEP